MRDHAEERRRPPHRQLLLLGQRHGRQLHRPVGKQDHVLHRVRLWTRNLILIKHDFSHKIKL